MPRLTRALALTAVALIAAVAAAPSASADRNTALALCRAGVGGNIFNANLSISSQDTEFGRPTHIWPGDVVRITATGGIRTDLWPWSVRSPAGISDLAPDGFTWPAPGLRKFSLVAGFDATDELIAVGADSGCIPYDGSSQTFLWLWMNDDHSLDNAGRWDIVVRVFA